MEAEEQLLPDFVRDEDGEITRVYGTIEDGDILAGVRLYVEPTEMSEADKLTFKYSVEQFDDEQLSLVLNFDNPEHVSASYDKDYLVINLDDFRDDGGALIVKE